MNSEDYKKTVNMLALGLVTCCPLTRNLSARGAFRALDGIADTFTKNGITGALPDGLKRASRVIRKACDMAESGELTPDNAQDWLMKEFTLEAPSPLN